MLARCLFYLAAIFSGLPAMAQPATPAALVEDVSGATPEVEFMDYLPSGKVVRLGNGDKLVLSYLKSCWRETIVSGTVTVGTEQSEVANGTVDRIRVACDGGKIKLSSEQAQKSGAMTFRSGPKKANQTPEITLFGLSPVIEARGAVTISIQRIDRAGETLEFKIGGPQLFRGAFFDLAKTGTALTAGGIYRIKAGTDELVFKIDPFAKPGNEPVISRLIRLKASS